MSYRRSRTPSPPGACRGHRCALSRGWQRLRTASTGLTSRPTQLQRARSSAGSCAACGGPTPSRRLRQIPHARAIGCGRVRRTTKTGRWSSRSVRRRRTAPAPQRGRIQQCLGRFRGSAGGRGRPGGRRARLALREQVGCIDGERCRFPGCTRLRLILLRERNTGLRVHQGQVIGRGDWEPVLERTPTVGSSQQPSGRGLT